MIWGIVGVERVVLDGGVERDDGELGRVESPRPPWKVVFLGSKRKRGFSGAWQGFEVCCKSASE